MSTLIPNENCYIAFASAKPLVLAAPKASEVLAALDITDFVISLTAAAQGNAVPTPRLKRLFETSIPGTRTASFSAEMYRDDVADTAYNAMSVVNAAGYFYISRFGGLGANNLPIALDKLEVWPVRIISAAGSAMSSNTAQTFTLTCAVPEEPVLNAVVAA